MTDISFRLDGHRFNYRVAAIIERQGRYLVATVSRVDYWFLPGGRVKMGETSEEALGRELQEELGIVPVKTQLVWMVENFFNVDAVAYHEMSLYFLVSLPEDSPVLAQQRFRREPDLAFRWIEAAELEAVDLRPRFLKAKLLQDKSKFAHIVFKNNQ